MNAELALATLEFAPNKAAKVIYKVLASAIANGNYDAQSVVVKSCRIDAGPVLRRMSPRARGRANMIRKPTAHISVEVADPKEIAKALEIQKAQKAQKVDSKPKNTNQKKLDSTKTPKSAPKAPKKENTAESSKKTTPKATKAPKDLGDSNVKLESKIAKDSNVKESKADSNAESKPKTKKPSATKTTTSEDK